MSPPPPHEGPLCALVPRACALIVLRSTLATPWTCSQLQHPLQAHNHAHAYNHAHSHALMTAPSLSAHAIPFVCFSSSLQPKSITDRPVRSLQLGLRVGKTKGWARAGPRRLSHAPGVYRTPQASIAGPRRLSHAPGVYRTPQASIAALVLDAHCVNALCLVHAFIAPLHVHSLHPCMPHAYTLIDHA